MDLPWGLGTYFIIYSETQFHLVNGVGALLAAAIPIYLTVRLNNDLRQLTAILSIFYTCTRRTFLVRLFWV